MVTRMSSGWERACLLVPGCLNRAPDAVERLVRRLGMHHGFIGQQVGAVVHLVTERSATLAFDVSRLGPFTVPSGWTELASRDEWVFLLVGPTPLSDPAMADAYLEQDTGQLATCLVPVANRKVGDE